MVVARITLICAVALAGQSVANALIGGGFRPDPHGVFDQKCGGSTGMECNDDQWCFTWTGKCDAEGVCLSKPTSCFFSSSSPVCGCDGSSYKSSCEAHKAGVALQSYTACAGDPIAADNVTVTPFFGVLQPKQLEPLPAPHKHRNVKCGQGAGECGDAQYCRMNSCGDTTGVCTDVPSFCPARRHSPVCGCDGFSYESMCEAARAKISVANRGACADAAPGALPVGDNTSLAPVEVSGYQCVVGSRACSDPRKTCVAKYGTCATDGVGLCVDASLMKCSHSKKVCGCDGLTYTSICEAYRNGISVQAFSACSDAAPLSDPLPPPPPPLAARVGDSCEDDDDCSVSWMYCDKPRGMCGGVGNCSYRKNHCGRRDKSATKTTVCGCDGTTYQSECHASASGVSVDQDGACFIATEEPSDEDGTCVSDVDCDSDEFCNFDQAECGNDSDRPGVCMTVPLNCPIPMFGPRFDKPQMTTDVARDAATAQAGGGAAGGPGGRVGAGGRGGGGRGGRGHGGNSHSFPWMNRKSGVCGCDGVTYTNTCAAHKARMSIQHTGKCSSGSSDGGPGAGWGGSSGGWGGWGGGAGGVGGGGGSAGGFSPWLWGGRKWAQGAMPDKITKIAKSAQQIGKRVLNAAGGDQ